MWESVNHRKRGRISLFSLVLVLVGVGGLGGCSQLRPRPAAPPPVPPAKSTAEQKSPIQLVANLLPPQPAHKIPEKVVPIQLDTVFRLTKAQNLQIQLAREKVHEAFTSKTLADQQWLPDFYLGVQYRRHDGGIQDPDGRLLNSHFNSLFPGAVLHGEYDVRENVYRRVQAERKLWEKRGKLSRDCSTTLLDATSTYMDMLAARFGEMVSVEMEGRLHELLIKAENMTKAEPGFKVESKRVATQLLAQQRVTQQLHKGSLAASARLVHLLELAPCVTLLPADPKLVPIHLIPECVKLDALVARATKCGPGVQELESLLAVIHAAEQQNTAHSRLMPVFEGRLYGGVLGAGPGSRMDWEDSWDLQMQARWQLTSRNVARLEQQRQKSKKRQAHLSYQQVRSKLALGVRDAYFDCRSNRQQIATLQHQIAVAEETYGLSTDRFENKIRGTSVTEVLWALRSVTEAKLQLISAVRDFNVAQLRLLILTGGPPPCPSPGPHADVPPHVVTPETLPAVPAVEDLPSPTPDSLIPPKKESR